MCKGCAIVDKRSIASALLWVSLLLPGFAAADARQDCDLAVEEFERGNMGVAMALWDGAAQQGYAPAQVWLGYIFDKAEEDFAAVGWYRKAADQGDAAGQFGLGEMLIKGEGVAMDEALGLDFVRKAAQQDHASAVALLMSAYRNGREGVDPDPVKADEWEARLVLLVPGYVPQKTKKK